MQQASKQTSPENFLARCRKIFVANGQRQSNIEMLRIIAMMLVVLVHCNYYSLGGDSTFDTHSLTGVTRIYCEQLCIVCIDVFVMISGWFGIKPKWEGALSILFQALFFGALITGVTKVIEYPSELKESAASLYYSNLYWYIPAYLILYVLAPILNRFVEAASKKELLTTIILFNVVQCLFGWLMDAGHFMNGYSAISFVGLYLLARFCRLYPVKLTSLSWKADIAMYLLVAAIPTAIAAYTGGLERQIAHNSPFVIIAALYLTLAFTKMSFRNRIVNWIASSAFAVYLVHMNPYAVPFLKSTMSGFYENHTGIVYVGICIITAIALLISSTLLDKLRMVAWEVCKSLFLLLRLNALYQRICQRYNDITKSE